MAAKGSARNYTLRTIKLLFAGCGNQCAAPNCYNQITTQAGTFAEAAVLGQICHIYAARDNGPRGNPNLTDQQRDAFENLILLCGHHHPLVDKQHQDYPADLLLRWKKEHEAKFRDGEAVGRRASTNIRSMVMLERHANKEVEAELRRIRIARTLPGFRADEAARLLAARIDTEELSSASSCVSAKALAWCARIVVSSEDPAEARAILDGAKRLGSCDEISIAEAFLEAGTNESGALRRLSALKTPASLDAALRIVALQRGADGAIGWAAQSGLDPHVLEADGKLAFLLKLLEARRWDEAFAFASAIGQADVEEEPALDFAIARALVIHVAPAEFRQGLAFQVPLMAHTFPMADDAVALNLRRNAQSQFQRAFMFAQRVGAVDAATCAADFALWLKLRDPRHHAEGLNELKASMRDIDSSLRRVPLALQFGIKLDLVEIERRISHNAALSGGAALETALARYALAFEQDGPAAVAEYLQTHADFLATHLPKDHITAFEIEALTKAGQMQAARERLLLAVANGLPRESEERLQRMLDDGVTGDAVAECRVVYEASGSIQDLIVLIHRLEDDKRWADLEIYTERLFSSTRSLTDARRYAFVLDRLHRYGTLHTFLQAHLDLVEQSDDLKMLHAWSLYRAGLFNDAKKVRPSSGPLHDTPNMRALRVNVAIASGDWSELSAYCQEEWRQRDARTAHELMALGKLASLIGGLHAKEFVVAACEKAPEDPLILAKGYFAAVAAGWEVEQIAGEWLGKAVRLSTGDGPLQRVSLREIAERQPDWARHERQVWDRLHESAIPVMGAARLLNRSQTEFFILQALTNRAEPDVRRRGVIYAFSQAPSRQTVAVSDRIALDPSALLTLGYLGELERVIGSFEQTFLAHSTLSWLLRERERAQFHQPTRITQAQELLLLLSNGSLRVFHPPPSPDPQLSEQIGADLSGMLLHANAPGASVSPSRRVVRSGPVPMIGSLMEEHADLSRFVDVLCSGGALAKRLFDAAAITIQEKERAESYFAIQGEHWPSEPEIALGAELYLDHVSVSHLRAAGLLGKLKRAGFTVFIPQELQDEANRLLALQDIIGDELKTIEHIRKAVTDGLESGRIHLGSSMDFDAEDDDALAKHPTFGILGAVGKGVTLTFDDRTLNRHAIMSNEESVSAPIVTSLELLDALVRFGVMTPERMYACRTELRRAGCQLMDLRSDELAHHIAGAQVLDTGLQESAELRAIRESFLMARMRMMVRLPDEARFFAKLSSAIIQAVTSIWQSGADSKDARARSTWLVSLLDFRGYSPSTSSEQQEPFARFIRVAPLTSLLMVAASLNGERREDYKQWMDGLLDEIKSEEPDLFRMVVGRTHQLMVDLAARTDNSADETQT